MSTAQGIQAVTDGLVAYLKKSRATIVTAKPPDKAVGSQLNVFLYHIAVQPGWRNQDLPRPAADGQPGRPPLPLTLYYMISAVGGDETTDSDRHEFLGSAMLLLHDFPLLRFDPPNPLLKQPDPIRITLQPLSLDEMYKLWSSFQAPYRPSVAYEVGTVLIESTKSDPTPLPVVRRGDAGRGWDSTAQMPPAVTEVRFRTENQPGFRLGEPVTVRGRNLAPAGDVQVVFRHPRFPPNEVRVLVPDRRTDGELTVTVPDKPADWPAGVYMVSVRVPAAGRPGYSSNAVPVALLPELTVPAWGLLAQAAGGGRTLTLANVRPNVAADQQVELFLGPKRIESVDVQADRTTVVGKWDAAAVAKEKPESLYARLRVDGVESLTYDPDDPAAGLDERYLVQGAQP